MEPTPETRRALEEFSRYGSEDIVAAFNATAERARVVAPDCVGVSVALLERGLAFTWIATDSAVAALDAVQYLDGGPCVDAVEEAISIDVAASDLLDEGRWLMFSQAQRAAGVASTLSIPLMRDGKVYGSVNLYGSTPTAFDGRHERLAAVFGGWAAGAVTNADLSFSTRRRAMETPQRLDDQDHVDQATGMIAAAHGVDIPTARQRLRQAAERAGLCEAETARFLVKTRIL